MTKACCLIVLAACSAFAQEPVTIRVDSGHALGPFQPVYNFFGYDEANYTYMKSGRKLIGELGTLSYAAPYIRTHFMLTTGDGTPGFKWGSTNAYTEDASGKPVYDWTLTDRIVETYLNAGAKPFVEIGFMPEALSSHPAPYRPDWKPGDNFNNYYLGWAYPPKDYEKWGELVYQWARHSVQKYGRKEVESWYWEVWNEPDIGYWHGTPEEYDNLYDYTAKAVKRALPSARVGGPASTGPSGQKSAAFLKQFLEHCAATGVPLDFISYHAKGRATVADGHVRMGLEKNAQDVEAGFQIVSSFPKFHNVPIVLTESDPEGCAGCSARVYPQNAYRNGPLYASYTAAMLKNVLDLADRYKTNIAGMLTWAFEFEDQPYFDGFRTLATNGIDKPILNLFRMEGLMRGNRVASEGGRGGVDALAVRGDREVSVLAWNYFADDVPAPAAEVQVEINGLPARVLLHHYRIDETHSNAWTVWKNMGSPQSPTPEQYQTLEHAGALQEFESPHWVNVEGATLKLSLDLPRQGISLIQAGW